MATLEAFLDEQIEAPATPEAQEAFTINSADQANWALRKLTQIRGKQEEIKTTAEREITRVQDWSFSETQKLEQEAEFFVHLLESYHRRVIAQDPKAKTITLPHGTLKLRAQQPEISRDDGKLLPWVETNHPALVRVKKETDWVKLKAVVQFAPDPDRPHFLIAVDSQTGERVPGVEALERPAKFAVEVTG